MKLLIILLFTIQFGLNFCFSQKKILFFVSHENTYYSELIVAKEALEAKGFIVDVRSANSQDASTYMIPALTTIEETANTLANSSYTEFLEQYNANFDSNWDFSQNDTPAFFTIDGSVMDIENMNEYEALVIAGGTGILDYRLDGTYASQGTNDRLISASEVQLVAEKLNSLAVDALTNGKVILAQCHGASLPVYWRIPGTLGAGDESLGFSFLKDQTAAGYPQAETSLDYQSLFVNYASEDRVTISSPHSSFAQDGSANYKIITSRDWYPQTVSHAIRTLLNVMETFPKIEEMNQELTILILHGGSVDSGNCHYTNRLNDIPCNYGTGINLPADFNDLVSLLNSNSVQDNYNFQVGDLNLVSATLPFDPNNEAEVLNYLNQFDGIVFYKHWSTGLSTDIQNAIKNYVDDGGGILALHHGLYNDIDGSLNKNILTNELFGVSSEMNTWSASLTNYDLYSTNYGDFISTFGLSYPNTLSEGSNWSTNQLSNGANSSLSTYHTFPIFDELYNNMQFTAGQVFGRGVNQIKPLFSNNSLPTNQMHTSGFSKLFNQNLDLTSGKLIYYEIGERKESININHNFGQVIRNSVFWVASDTISQSAKIEKNSLDKVVHFSPNPFTDEIILKSKNKWENIQLIDLLGKVIFEIDCESQTNFNFSNLEKGTYIIKLSSKNEQYMQKIIKN